MKVSSKWSIDCLHCVPGIPAYDSSGADFIQKWVSRVLVTSSRSLYTQVNPDSDRIPRVRIPAIILKEAYMLTSTAVFPGGYIPSFCFLIETMNRATSGRLTVDSVANIGPHYARTLREWKRRFLSNWTDTIAPALVDKYSLDEADLEVFRRKWICEPS